jgi:hypothetical protein
MASMRRWWWGGRVCAWVGLRAALRHARCEPMPLRAVCVSVCVCTEANLLPETRGLRWTDVGSTEVPITSDPDCERTPLSAARRRWGARGCA